MLDHLVFGTPEWLVPAVVLGLGLTLLTLWSYVKRGVHWGVRLVAAGLKLMAVIALALCLLEPLYSGVRPRPGANLFIIASDNSQSLQLQDRDAGATRAELAAAQLDSETAWQTRLSQDFDVRRYQFDAQVKPVVDFSDLTFDGAHSALGATLATIGARYQGRPVAGVLLLTDGNATDVDEQSLATSELPPVYPVTLGDDRPTQDIRVTRVSVSQTNFEASPVTILVEAECIGYSGEKVVFTLQDEAGGKLQQRIFRCDEDEQSLVHRFLMRPETSGISFYKVVAVAEDDVDRMDRPERSSDVTLLNNSRLVVVDRGGGPYRVLYVSGRPNWDFKYLRRALAADDEVQLVGLIRIAEKEPKFTFRGHSHESTNPLFRGFGNQEDEEAEQYDQPVLLRIGTRDATELRDGFPKAADELFGYDAIVLDDVEAAFFTQDQMSLLQEFVSRRGGGFLMLGGNQSFASGKYARTPIGELLPVYPHRSTEPTSTRGYQLALTREGWLQPWVRLRSNETDEENRLAAMPRFRTANLADSIKPGATVLAHIASDDDQQHPALVAQRFGKGRSAALLLGDFWRWQLRRPDPADSDLEKAWRQTIRWLVAEVPGRLDVEVREDSEILGALKIHVRVRDEEYEPLDNAEVEVTVVTTDKKSIELNASPNDNQAGSYMVEFSPRLPGAYRAEVVARAPDGSEIERRPTGWAHEPATREFEALLPNRNLMQKLADETGGEVLKLDQLDRFVASLPNRKIPVTEPWIFPLWHQWGVLVLAVCCLAGEWGLRRWKGLP
jgi:hypothetical protein